MTTSTTDQGSKWHKHIHHFDIDNYLNRFVPRPRFHILPRPISHFFGYRPPNQTPAPPPPNPVNWISACVGGFVGIAIITAVYRALPLLDGRQAPLVIASFGAAAILEYNTIESPLSQPRNLIVGHLLSALVGVSITKGFEHLPEQRFDELRWLAGSISVGVASMVMSITKTVHPPAGATALLASTSVEITVLGWWLLPLVLLASCLMSASALIINNLTRRWPIYWWTPVDLSKKDSDIKHVKDVEKDEHQTRLSMSSGSVAGSFDKQVTHIEDRDQKSQPASRMAQGTNEENVISKHKATDETTIVIGPHSIILPDGMDLDEWETEIMEIFRQKLARRQQT